MNTPLKPLDKIIEIVEALELNVSYEYDDLVFVEHNPFLIRFDEVDSQKIYLHFNEDCEPAAAVNLEKALSLLAKNKDLDLIPSARYKMEAKEETDEIQLIFETGQ